MGLCRKVYKPGLSVFFEEFIAIKFTRSVRVFPASSGMAFSSSSDALKRLTQIINVRLDLFKAIYPGIIQDPFMVYRLGGKAAIVIWKFIIAEADFPYSQRKASQPADL